MDRHVAFDEVTYPNSWQILRKHKNLAGRPLKPGVSFNRKDNMKKITVLFLLFILLTSTSSAINLEEEANWKAISGSWHAEIKPFTTQKLPEQDVKSTYQVAFLNCENSPKIYLNTDGKSFGFLNRDFVKMSKSGNYILTAIKDGGDWVETQIWSFVKISDKEASIQWSRMVNNPEVKPDHELRSFGN